MCGHVEEDHDQTHVFFFAWHSRRKKEMQKVSKGCYSRYHKAVIHQVFMLAVKKDNEYDMVVMTVLMFVYIRYQHRHTVPSLCSGAA